MGVVRIEDAIEYVEKLQSKAKDLEEITTCMLILSVLECSKQPDMRFKAKEVIKELDEEMDRCETLLKNDDSEQDKILVTRIQTLNECKGTLQSRLEELV